MQHPLLIKQREKYFVAASIDRKLGLLVYYFRICLIPLGSHRKRSVGAKAGNASIYLRKYRAINEVTI
jgi:hypothetical protein